MTRLELAAVRGHVSEVILALGDEVDDDLREALIHLVAASMSLRRVEDRQAQAEKELSQ